MKIVTRFSTKDDKDNIEELILACFGDRSMFGVFDNLDCRYLLAFDKKRLVAMTGLTYSDIYHGYEIDWTCTHPEYRGRGIMHQLFEKVCTMTKEPIYCSCWRQCTNEHVNLYKLMQDFGFEEVVKNRLTVDSRYNCPVARTFCVYFNNQGSCRCCEDLYLRPKR